VKLNRAVFRYVEHELYNYDNTLVEMHNLREGIIEAPPLREAVPGTGYVSDPTARKATQLVTNTALARMARPVAASSGRRKKLKRRRDRWQLNVIDAWPCIYRASPTQILPTRSA